ncbi:complement C3-like isoform X1 [Gadus macrocephalus]|uniref:complement C3-like isoform X1 n=2 Tax=Gadus macrocephalus TaxID=80720 RepID=UPI0028CB5734|nr:complement C3-like isoform X1 [Gadus macrocephalus]
MYLEILPLSVACLVLFLSSVANGDPLKVLSAPNLLRIGATENIFVECHDCSGADIDVQIVVKLFPTGALELDSTTVTLTEDNNFQAFGEIKIPAEEFENDPTLKQHVSLEARFPDGTSLKKVVLVSFQSGYIFIQTNKPLYTPNSKVHYRVFGLTSGMKPFGLAYDEDSIININIVTPDEIILPVGPVSLASGIHHGSYILPEIVSNGMWTVVATFQNNKHHNYSAEFEVKDYVLPSFEVTITPDKPFFYVDDEMLTVDIRATYLFGKEVEGSAYVVFGMFDKNNEKHSFPGSIQRVMVINGKAQATLTRTQIQETYPDIENEVKSSIYVAVTVLTESGSELVEAEKQGINIVASPYTINLKKTPKYFKPTMFFEVLVYVEYPDGSPAADVPVRVDPGDIEVTTTKNGLARVLINPSGSSPRLDITAKTADPQVSNIRQTSATMTALPYNSGIGSYLHIGVGSSEVRLGDDLIITLSLNAPTTTRDITYLIQSRGQLVKHGRFRVALTTIAMTLPVTKEMLPSFRIIAYHRDRSEVVSDSVWVDVIDTCMGSLKLVPASALPSEPRQTFRYTITGDPGATVGLVAVDKGVYALNNKHRLTQRKVWDVVEKADTGCTPGGGEDSMNVFYDAGLLFQSDLIGTADRQVFKCEVSTRMRRAPATLDVRSTLVSEYKDSLLRQCCLDGMAETPLSYSCERRREYISDGKACADAFLKCCQELTKLRTESKTARTNLLRTARSGPRDIIFKDSRQIGTRTESPEGWLWADYKLPLCPYKDPKCKTTSLEKRTALRDSITTWHLTGISLSPTHGICIDDTLKIVVLKNFFIDLRLPYAAVRGEQIEIKAILHNYLLDDITVRVYLKEETDVCSLASMQEEYTQTVRVAAESTRSVSFLIIPMRHGKYPIEVKASVGDLKIKDGVRKELLVVPEGIKKKVQVNRNLKVGKGQSKQVEIIPIPIDVANIVSNKPTILEIHAKGSQVNLLVEKVLSGSSTGSLIRQPRGNGEQNMMSMTLPLIAAMYLEKTKQWDTVGLSKRDNALEYIKTGYQNELAFRKVDGAFSTSIGTTGLSWLTSYVAKLFSMAFYLVDIDINTICGAIKWVILRSQQPDGRFIEIGPVIHGEMMGDVRGSDSDASMTAFSLIAIQEARPICGDIVHSMTGSINAAVGYLEGRLPSLTNPYAVAMVSYALANENKLNKEILYRFVSQDSTHWPVANHELFTLEATAYALLALVKVKEFEDAAPIVKWLNTQRTVEGGYGSTQSTIMVYQAVAEYWVNAKEQEHEMDIEIQVPHRMIPIRINKKYTFWTTWLRGIYPEVKVTATGLGEATLSLVSMYYERLTTNQTSKSCERFELNVELKTDRIAEDGNIYMLKIEILYRDADKDAGMTILDIGLPSGYTPDIADLNQLSRGRDRTISKYVIDRVPSNRGSLIIYLDTVSHTQPEEVAFKIRQTMKVGVLQPATVSVYEFYNPEKHCVKYYHPAGDRVKMQVCCQEDVCKCNREECSMQTKGEINTKERIEKACDPEARIDYVYKVTMESYEEQNSTDVYKMRINQVIKEGSSDQELNDKLQTFIGYSHCREILNLELNKSYLIMGRVNDTLSIGGIQYEYLLREKTWIEYWPTELECRTPKYRPTCKGIEDLNLKLVFDGCMEWRYGIMD